jgi:glycosyltransferase involved in cell wall biosynthesis
VPKTGVLVDVSALAWPTDSGIPRYVSGLANALAECRSSAPDIDLSWVCASHRATRHFDLAGLRPLSVLPIPYRYAGQLCRLPFWGTPKVDVYHGPAQEWALANRARRTVVTLHDVGPLVMPDLYPAEARQRFRRLIDELPDRADLVATISSAVRCELLDRTSVDPRRVHVVYPGVEEDFFADSHDAPLPPLPEEFVLFAGVMQPRKNVGVLLQALALLRQESRFRRLKLVLLGSTGWRADADEQIVQKLRLSDAVLRTGYVPRQLVSAYFRKASAVAMCSRYEGFGFPVAEAMASGTPVVVSEIPTLVEVADGAALSFPVDDPTRLASALAKVLDDQGLRQTLIAKGRQRAELFRWRRAAFEFLSLYRELAEN